jgi:hypothetical protein
MHCVREMQHHVHDRTHFALVMLILQQQILVPVLSIITDLRLRLCPYAMCWVVSLRTSCAHCTVAFDTAWQNGLCVAPGLKRGTAYACCGLQEPICYCANGMCKGNRNACTMCAEAHDPHVQT